MIEDIRAAIRDAELRGHISVAGDDVLTGFSGSRLVGSLQRLARLFAQKAGTCYVEIGVFQGLTLLSVAAAAPKLDAYGIDNFSFVDPEGRNASIVESRRKSLNATNVRLLDMDFEEALDRFSVLVPDRKIGVYFVDGPHDYRSQIVCLLGALAHLHERAVIIVDDCNYSHVRQANRDFLKAHSEFKLLFEAYTPAHPANLPEAARREAQQGWWNGVNVIVRDPDDVIVPVFPDACPYRRCFVNDHWIHGHRYGEMAPVALRLFTGLERPYLLPLEIARLIFRFVRHGSARRGKFLELNTFSNHLPSLRWAEIR